MFNKHLIKVILSFCGMILLGLITLVVINSLNEKNIVKEQAGKVSPESEVNKPVTLPPINASSTKVKSPIKR
ncbi:hypothetical protein K8Q96_01905 [Candidatus Nomurabacteria bacterium]|nr:hypothetical protein [Candidatus Nomurabacteria bacterium]